MSQYVPDPWTFVLLGLAAWRVWTLFASDKILEKTMDAFYRRLPRRIRQHVIDFVECPYCFGSWVALGWWIVWLIAPNSATIAAVPWALFAVVALIETAKHALVASHDD